MIQPLGKRVLVKPLEKEEKTKGGLYIPETASENNRSQEGEVMVLGVCKKDHAFKVKVGDRIFFKKYSSEEFELEGQKYIIVEEKDILAIIK